MKTRDEIKHLKESWLCDPCWDIENTEEFEDEYEELKAFRLYYEKIWSDRRNKELEEKSDLLGLPGNVALVKQFERLESRIEKLEEENERLQTRLNIRSCQNDSSY